MKKSEGRYDKYENEEILSFNLTRSLSMSDRLNLRNKELTEIPYETIQESGATIIGLGFNKICKLTLLPENLIKLELKNNRIIKIQNLECSIQLQILDLSNNQISRIENLQSNILLQELHLGDNHIKKIENLEMLKNLRRLNIENNLLSSSVSIRTLSLNTKLTFLVLKGNPLAAQGKYKPTVTSLLPKLIFLDYARIQTQGFKRKEFCNDFFSEPFFESDIAVNLQLLPTPKSVVLKRKNSKVRESVRISTETQTFQNNSLNRADAEVQTFHDEQFKEISLKSTLKEIKLPQFKSSNSVEMGKTRKHFKAISIFKDLPSSAIENFIKASEFKIVQESEIILFAESIVEKLIIISKGSVQYMNKIYNYGNHLFAESLLIPEEVKSDVLCKEVSELFVLGKAEFEKVLRLFPVHRELIMKNYLEKNVSASQFQSRLKPSLQARRNSEKRKIGKNAAEKSKSLSKLNLKGLINSRTSKDLGFAANEIKGFADDSVAHRVQKEIDSLFRAADPFDFTVEEFSNPEPDRKYMELAEKVDSLYGIYLKDIQQAKTHKDIEEEAKEFSRNGYKSEVEIIAMEREQLKKIVSACVFDENGENLWMYEYVQSLDRASEDIKNQLTIRAAEVQEEIQSCQSALQTFLNQSSQSLSVVTIKNYKIILDDCELLKPHEDPYGIIRDMCGSYFSNQSVKQAAEDVVGLMVLANKLKEALGRVIKAQELDDTLQLIQVRQQLQDQGLLLSQLHSSIHFNERSSSM